MKYRSTVLLDFTDNWIIISIIQLANTGTKWYWYCCIPSGNTQELKNIEDFKRRYTGRGAIR